MIDIILSQTKEKMRKAIEVTRMDLSSIRSGRATSSLVENIYVLAYEGTQKLRVQEMATIGVPDARRLSLHPLINNERISSKEFKQGVPTFPVSDDVSSGLPFLP